VVALLGKAFNPLLSPIQKLVPPLGGLDFSPMILMILIQVLGAIIVSVLRNFR
jgi:YggT family protein